MLNKIKNKFKSLRVSFLSVIQLKRIINQLKNNDSKRIFLFQTPTHSNIGDHAIANAQLIFFKDNFPGYNVIEVNQTLMTIFIKYYNKLIKYNDIIFIHGGGNFGNEYMHEEFLRRLVVESFPNNKIISFPQTIYYSNDAKGQKELSITQTIFSNHKNLTITAREEVSYELMKQYFPNNKVILTPDIVLYTSNMSNHARNYALEVIRQDQESLLSDSDKIAVKKILNDSYKHVICSDMHVENFRSVISPEEREIVLRNKFTQFQKAHIVITDRLHGMVLAAITGTPCIVFSNYNQKVLGTYNWIKYLTYIRFVNNIEEAKIAFIELKDLERFEVYKPNDLKKKYQPLIDAFND